MLRKYYKSIIAAELFVPMGIFILSKILVLTLAYISFNLILANEYTPEANFNYYPASNTIGEILSPWDGQWYLYIADTGYSPPILGHYDLMKFAFLPLFPLILRGISIIFPLGLDTIATLSNFVFGLMASIVLYKLVKLDFKKNVALNSVLFFSIMPAAIFYSAVYTESLFFLFVTSTFYFTRKKLWLVAAIFASLASITKPNGILLAIPILVEFILYLELSKKSLSISKIKLQTIFGGLSILLIPITFLITSLILQSISGHSFTSLHELFGRSSPSITHIIPTLVRNVFFLPLHPLHSFFASKIDSALLLLYLIMLFPIFIKFRLSYSIYATLIVFSILSTGTTMSSIRLLSLSFPHIMLIANWSNKSDLRQLVMLLLSISLMTLCTIMYVKWYWVA